jgi:hypothetical protein
MARFFNCELVPSILGGKIPDEVGRSSLSSLMFIPEQSFITYGLALWGVSEDFAFHLTVHGSGTRLVCPGVYLTPALPWNEFLTGIEADKNIFFQPRPTPAKTLRLLRNSLPLEAGAFACYLFPARGVTRFDFKGPITAAVLFGAMLVQTPLKPP